MSSPVPVIVGFGGINPAGRVSFDHAYRRTVVDVIGKSAADDTYASLAGLMNVGCDPTDESVRQHILDNTLIRRIDCFDPESIQWQRSARLAPPPSGPVSFTISNRDLPDEVPAGWSLREREDGRIEVTRERLQWYALHAIGSVRAAENGKGLA